jgi:hypothetical protein
VLKKEHILSLAKRNSALAGFVALLHLVDDVDTAFAAHEPIGAVAVAQRLQGIANFHNVDSDIKAPVELAQCKPPTCEPDTYEPTNSKLTNRMRAAICLISRR